MMVHRPVVSQLKYGLAPRIIACVAGLWSENDKYCLPIQTAAGVIRESGSRVLVLHIPRDIQMLDNETLSCDELIKALEIPLSEMILFFNTSLCSTLEEVEQIVEMMDYFCTIPPYNSTSAFLKLEILYKNLLPEDEKICEIMSKLRTEICQITIPYLTGTARSVDTVTTLGCPAARIWCSDIGQRMGINDRVRLEMIAQSTQIPLILEGGLATSDDVRQALQLGFDAVLINSAFRYSANPVHLATNIRAAIDNLEGTKE